MKKVLLLILIASNLSAQKPLQFALKYNFAPNIYEAKSFGMAMEFPISKIISVDLSRAGGYDGSASNKSNSLKYQTTLAELRLNYFKIYHSTKFRGFAGPYFRHKYVDRYRAAQNPKDYFQLFPKIDYQSKAVSMGIVGGVNVAIKERLMLEVKMGIGYGKRYEVSGNDFPDVFSMNPIDGVAGLSLGYNFKQ